MAYFYEYNGAEIEPTDLRELFLAHCSDLNLNLATAREFNAKSPALMRAAYTVETPALNPVDKIKLAHRKFGASVQNIYKHPSPSFSTSST